MTLTRTTDVQATAREYRAALLAKDAATRRDMAAAWARVRTDIGVDAEDLLRTIERRGITSPNQLYRLERYGQFMAQTEARLEAYAAGSHDAAIDLVGYASLHGAEAASAMIGGTAAGAGTMLTMQNARAVEYLVGRVQYGAAAELFQTIPKTASQAVARELIHGIAAGQHPYKTARAIRRAADVSVYNAQRIARTETMTAYRSANLDRFRSSASVQVWQWFASLDDRCCPICWAMHGTLHPKDEMMDTHVNCRCAPVPLSMTPEEAAREGLDMVTGAERFAGLPGEQQLAILGPGRYAAYEGGVPLSGMVAKTQDPVWGGGRALIPVRDLSPVS